VAGHDALLTKRLLRGDEVLARAAARDAQEPRIRSDDPTTPADPCPADTEEILRRIPELATLREIAALLGYSDRVKAIGNVLYRYRTSNPNCAIEDKKKDPRGPSLFYRSTEVVEVIRDWIRERGSTEN
jgi:hypothetical protein